MTRVISPLARPRLLATATLLIATFATAQAFAQDPTPATPPPPPPVGGSLGYFGERGQFVVSSDLDFTLQRTSRTMNGGSSTSFSIAPGLDYFISPNFSVGGRLFFGYSSGSSGNGAADVDLTVFGLGARAGYNIVLSNAFTWWINGGLVYFRDSFEVGGTDGSGNRFQLQVFAPFLWHPASHFFIGLGPAFATDLVSSFEGEDVSKETSFGLLSTIGGYWGGL